MNTSFRHLATHLWQETNDPSTYGEVDVDLTAFEDIKNRHNITLLGLLMKALTEGYKAVPQVNSYISRKRVVPRQHFSISLMVPHDHDDLCFANFADLDSKDLMQMNAHVQETLAQIKTQKGVDEYRRILKIIRSMPHWLLRWQVPILKYLIVKDFFKIPFVPRRAFGSLIVSNVGSLGLHRGFLPLVGFSKASVMVALGKVMRKPWVSENQVVIRSVVTVGFNLDHRIMDGFHAQKFIAAFLDVFHNPDNYLKNN